MENAYTKQVIYDDYSQSFKEVKAHNQKNIEEIFIKSYKTDF